jgi:hypothetical protein
MYNDINFNKGSILLGEGNHPRDGNNHYIIFFEDLNGYDFIGGMISTSPYRGINIPMKSSHFEVENTGSGKNWEVSYFKSHLVPTRLHKFNNMGPFSQVGQLTSEGIDFMTNTIKDKPLLTWDEYKATQLSQFT